MNVGTCKAQDLSIKVVQIFSATTNHRNIILLLRTFIILKEAESKQIKLSCKGLS